MLCVAIGVAVFAFWHILLKPASLAASMHRSIQEIRPSEFDHVIGYTRSRVTTVWFFNEGSRSDKDFVDVYNKVAADLGDMVKLAAVGCNARHEAFCQVSDVKETPKIVMFPPGSAPSLPYQGKMDAKALENQISKLIPDKTTTLNTKASINSFLKSDRAMRKAILFSSKKVSPTMFKALSSDEALMQTVKFGFVSETSSDVVKRFKVNQFPTLILVSEDREEYKGETTFAAVKEWLTSRV
jgi:thioredoxin-like negative regulator of GroEL